MRRTTRQSVRRSAKDLPSTPSTASAPGDAAVPGRARTRRARRPCLALALVLAVPFAAGCGAAAAARPPPAAGRATTADESTASMVSPASVESAPASMPEAPRGAAPSPSAPASPGAPSRAAGVARGAPSGPVSPRVTRSADAVSATPHSAMIIYAGELHMRVDASRVTATLDGAIDAAEALGGYFAARNDASVQLRIPSAHFRESLARLESLGAVTHRAIRASDVSEEHHDFEVRLTNLRATRARMQELLSRAASMTDTLTVERELERVAQEIDVIEGKLAYLESHAAFSQIDLAVEAKPATGVAQVTEPPPPRLVDLPVPWLGALGVGRLLSLR